MPTTNVLAGVAVKNLVASVDWYQALFGRPPDARPIPTAAEWRFDGGGWLHVFQDATRAGSSSVMLAESSLDERIGELKSGNVQIASTNQSGFLSTAVIHDPDGNEVVFVESLGASHPAVD